MSGNGAWGRRPIKLHISPTNASHLSLPWQSKWERMPQMVLYFPQFFCNLKPHLVHRITSAHCSAYLHYRTPVCKPKYLPSTSKPLLRYCSILRRSHHPTLCWVLRAVLLCTLDITLAALCQRFPNASKAPITRPRPPRTVRSTTPLARLIPETSLFEK